MKFYGKGKNEEEKGRERREEKERNFTVMVLLNGIFVF